MRRPIIQLILALMPLSWHSAASAADDCRSAVEFPSSLRAEDVLIFGEIHGTAETPALVAEYACWITQQDEKVIVALEIEANEQPRVDAYLNSEGSERAREELLQGIFWSRQSQDGRASVAVFELIERIRELKAAGRDLSVVAFIALEGGLTRDAAMANSLLSLIQRAPTKKVVILVGNLHAVKSVGGLIAEPMAYHLKKTQPVSLNVTFLEGSVWACFETCDVHRLPSKPVELRRAPGVYLGQSARPGDFDGTIVLPTATPSPPAKTAVMRNDG